MARRPAAEVARSRLKTLDEATSLASEIGLEGLSIGLLADKLEMSKSGLAGRFGSKEQLQLATLERAVEVFRETVYEPAADEAPGLRRLSALCDAWIDYLGDCPFPGGCFLTTASVEFDSREGVVKDRVKEVMARWLGVLEHEAAVAVDAGELPADFDPADVAFTLNALAVGTNCDFQLHRDPRALERARRMMATVLSRRAA